MLIHRYHDLGSYEMLEIGTSPFDDSQPRIGGRRQFYRAFVAGSQMRFEIIARGFV
jgi:hypothetical protein